MKALIASDIHGSAYWAQRLVEAIDRENPDRILLLGDLLYHGPRNDLPRDYDPKQVITYINELAQTGRLIAVRGNCDSEVDQMVLHVPCLSDYTQLIDEVGNTLFLTHGHLFGAGFPGSSSDLPVLPNSSAVLFGHTHVKINEVMPHEIFTSMQCTAESESAEDACMWVFNPGSIALPKDGTHSYGVYESSEDLSQAFSHVILEEE